MVSVAIIISFPPPKLLDDIGKSEEYKTQRDTHASPSDIAYKLDMED